MYDHIGFTVADVARSRAFYLAALTPLGCAVLHEEEGWAMLGDNKGQALWIGAMGSVARPIHIAFSATTRAQVHQFYTAALAAGGTDNGPPGLRPQYAPTYYAAFVHDPDGHNIEAVCHAPE